MLFSSCNFCDLKFWQKWPDNFGGYFLVQEGSTQEKQIGNWNREEGGMLHWRLRGDGAIDNPVNKRQHSSIKLLELAWKCIGNLKGERKKKLTLAISEREILFLHHAAWARRLAVPGRGQGQHSHDTVALFQSWNEISCIHCNAVSSEITSSWVAAIFTNSS